MYVNVSEETRKKVMELSMIDAGVLLMIVSKFSPKTGVVMTGECGEGRVAVPVDYFIETNLKRISREEATEAVNTLFELGVFTYVTYDELKEIGVRGKRKVGEPLFMKVSKEFSFTSTYLVLSIENGVVVKKPVVTSLYYFGVPVDMNSGDMRMEVGGLLLKIAMYMYKDYGVVVSNPEAHDESEAQMMLLKEFCKVAGITESQFYLYCFIQGGATISPFRYKVNEHDSNVDFYIRVIEEIRGGDRTLFRGAEEFIKEQERLSVGKSLEKNTGYLN